MLVKIMVAVVIIAVLSVMILLVLVLTKPQLFDKRIKDEDTPISYEDEKPKSVQSNSKYGSTSNETIGDTKSFFPVKSFEDYAMNLGRHNYRAIIECSSINYSLMSEVEQQMVEGSYTQFLNSLSFPISIYIQTREFDSETMLLRLEENIANAKKSFPNISEYADLYKRDMENLTLYIGNSKIKKKYIIVPYNNFDLSDVSALSNYEIKQFALEELMSRCSIVVNGMNATGVSAKILSKPEIAECLYSYYHRDTYKIASDIIAGEFTTLAVNSNNSNFKLLNKRERLDFILNDAQERIKEQAKDKDISTKEQEFYKYIYETLETFKQDAKAKDIFTLLDETEDEAISNGYRYERYQFRQNNERPAVSENIDYSSLTVPDNMEPGYSGAYPNELNSGIFTTQNTNENYVDGYSGTSSPPPIFDFGDGYTTGEGNTDVLSNNTYNNY